MSRIVTGYHAIEEKLKQPQARGILFISRKNARIEQLIKLTKGSGVSIKRVKEEELKRMGGGAEKGCLFQERDSSPTQARRYASLAEFLESGTPGKRLVLILDGITDTHNLGAILRSSDLLGVDLVIVPGRRSAAANETVRRISSGAAEHVPQLTLPNIHRPMEQLKEAGFWIYGAEMGGEAAHNLDLKGDTVLVMGSEGSGLSSLSKKLCDSLVSIPMKGHIDSLNVSVATGILLYEIARQRNFS